MNARMKEILELNIELAKYLNEEKPQMIADLKNILLDKAVVYDFGKSRADVSAFYFEYEWEHLDIACWAADNTGEVLNDALILPTENNSKAHPNSKWESFMPEKIAKTIFDLLDKYDGEEVEEAIEVYENEKYDLFENWFYDCWKQAINETGLKVDAYFSMHDSGSKVDLNTMEELTDKQISERY